MKFTVEFNDRGNLELRANGVCLPGLSDLCINSYPGGLATITATIFTHPAMTNRFIFRDEDGTST